MSVKCCCCLGFLKHFGDKNGFGLFECQSCGFITTRPLPTFDELKTIYSKQYFVKSNLDQNKFGYQDIFSRGSENSNKKISKLRLGVIFNMLKKKGFILDAGCANGGFLGMAVEEGWDASGIEINQEMRDIAALGLGGKIFSNIGEVFGLYDVITMWEYLEHVRSPEDVLRNVQSLLKPQGLLCLSFPNIESRKSYKNKVNWEHVKPPEHLHYWKQNNIISLLSRFNFTTVGFRYFGFRFPIEANRKYGRRVNPKTRLWPLTGIIDRACRPFSHTRVKDIFPYRIRRLYEGVEVYARYIG